MKCAGNGAGEGTKCAAEGEVLEGKAVWSTESARMLRYD